MPNAGVLLMRRSLHPGAPRRDEPKPEPVVVEEPIFDPEAGKPDDTPFIEDIPTNDDAVTSEDTEKAQDDYDSMTVEQLKALCRAAGLPVSGTKAQLVERLRTLTEAPEESAAEESEDAPAEAAAPDEGSELDGGNDGQSTGTEPVSE